MYVQERIAKFTFFLKKVPQIFAYSEKSVYFCTRIRQNDLFTRSVPSLKGSGFSAVGSAHVWGARGRWFESSNPDRKEKAENQ